MPVSGFEDNRISSFEKLYNIIKENIYLIEQKFDYTFKMIPRSQREAKEIREIIRAFKYNMLPEIDGSADKGRRMIVPNTFDI